MLVRWHQTVSGNLCKSYAWRYFWRFTLTTLLLGWWSGTSFWATLFALPSNVRHFAGCLTMEAPPPGVTGPALALESIRKLEPFTEEIVTRIGAGAPVQRVAWDVARASGLTSAHVLIYFHLLARATDEPD